VRRLLLIANPSASGFTGALHREVVADLQGAFEVVPVWPDGPIEAADEARRAAASGFDVVVAMGGDGVVHHTANGLVGTTTALGVIPAGTTNVLARILGFPSNPKRAARLLPDAQAMSLPLIHVATESRTGARSEYATFAVGIGFDAEVVAVAEQRPYAKIHFGSLHYARAAAGRLFGGFRNRRPNLRVEADGRRHDAVTVMVQVHSPYTYFGRVPLKVTSEHLEGPAALVVERLTPLVAARLLERAVTGRPLDAVPGVEVWTGFDKLVVEADPAGRYQADGESLGATASLEVTPAPDAIRVLVPAGSKGPGRR
jgi:diacylglycerol kinase family enzyme